MPAKLCYDLLHLLLLSACVLMVRRVLCGPAKRKYIVCVSTCWHIWLCFMKLGTTHDKQLQHTYLHHVAHAG